jgi:hypothetical protein
MAPSLRFSPHCLTPVVNQRLTVIAEIRNLSLISETFRYPTDNLRDWRRAPLRKRR